MKRILFCFSICALLANCSGGKPLTALSNLEEDDGGLFNNSPVPRNNFTSSNCFANQSPRLELASGPGAVYVGQSVTWRVSLPSNCSGSFQVVQNGQVLAGPFSGMTTFNKTYQSVGFSNEVVQVISSSASATVGSIIQIQAATGVPQQPQQALACNVQAYPDPVQVQVNAQGQVITPGRATLIVTSPRPTIVSSIQTNPFSQQFNLPQTPSTSHLLEIGIGVRNDVSVTVNVMDAATGAPLGSCPGNIRVASSNSAPQTPPGFVMVQADGKSGTVTADAANVKIRWASIFTLGCTVSPINSSGIFGEQTVAVTTRTTFTVNCIGQNGFPVPPATVTVDPAIPAPVITSVTYTEDDGDVSFSIAANQPSTFIFEYGQNPNNLNQVLMVNTLGTGAVLDFVIEEDRDYFYRIRAKNAAGKESVAATGTFFSD